MNNQNALTSLALCLAICLFVSACAVRQPGMVRDLESMPQDAFHFVSDEEKHLISPEAQAVLYEDYVRRFFSPWKRDQPGFSRDQVFWGLDRYRDREIFGENNLPRAEAWIDEMEYKSNIPAYPLLHIPGIAVVHASMRVLPMHRPVFYDPSRPGEGFPFDYMQNSIVPAGTPLLVTHESRDRAWVLVETGYAAGWIRRHEFAVVNDEFIRAYETDYLAGFKADDVSVLSREGDFLVAGRVGMALPLALEQDDPDFVKVQVPVRDHDGQARISLGLAPAGQSMRMPFIPDQRNFARVFNAMMGQAYGWGGLYENRDCSALIRDALAGFGVFLPRNSREQARTGAFISLEGLSAGEKKKLISSRGRPWLTILYMPGHVMLYLGIDPVSGQEAVYHSMWGLRTWRAFQNEHGRWVLGRTVITSLEPGKEMSGLVRPQGLLVERLTGMVFPVEQAVD